MNRRLAVGLAAGAVVVFVAVLVLMSLNSTAASRKVDVGSILGLTGDGAAYGQKMQRGFEFAVEEINAAGGVNGKLINLVVEDSQFDPAKAVTAFRKLNAAQGIRIIVGVTGSKNAIPVCQASKGEDVVIVDALGSAPMLTTHGGPNYFRIMASDALAGRYNVTWAIEGGMRMPAVVYMEDDWGASYRDALVQYLGKQGFSNVPTHSVTSGMRDFRVQVEKLKGQHPDTIFLLLYAKEGSAFMQQLREAGIQAAVYGSDNISSQEFVSAGAEVVEGVRVALPAPVGGQRYQEFVRKCQAKFGEAPDVNIIKSYDAMKLVAYAIGKVGEEPSKIKEYLRSLDFEFLGVSGPIRFDEHGDLVGQDYTRMVYRSGRLVPVK